MIKGCIKFVHISCSCILIEIIPRGIKFKQGIIGAGINGLRGQGGPQPKIIFNVIFVEGRQSYQMLFTGSKNIDPSRIYRIFKIEKYIQLPCGCTLYSRLSQNFDTKNLSPPTVF